MSRDTHTAPQNQDARVIDRSLAQQIAEPSLSVGSAQLAADGTIDGVASCALIEFADQAVGVVAGASS